MTSRPIRVLHLEDSHRDADIIGHKLAIGGLACEIALATDRDSFEKALARERFDVILCDYNVPDYDGVSALQLARTVQPQVPVIIISGTVGEDEAVKCLHAGATDYLLKQHLERLVPAVRRAMQEADERRKRAQAEEALLQRERRLSSIYEAVADMLFYLEVDGRRYRFLSVNPAFVAATGLEYEHVVGKYVDDVLPAASLGRALEHYERAIRERQIVRWEETVEYPRKRLDGEVSIAPVFDHTGRCTHLVGAVRDVTERNQLELQLRQAQKMESVGQLAGGIAHDFNNLLTVINGLSDLILAELQSAEAPLREDLREDLEEIRRAGERAAALTRQLLAFSRRQVLQPQVIDLNQIVRQMEPMLRRLIGEDIDLRVERSVPLGHIKADPGQMEQVIANLVVNARDAMPNGGRLTIETQPVELTGEDARRAAPPMEPGRYIALAVSDTGCGMDEDTRRKIFEPFFTTKGPGKGTGLGLSTSYGIIRQSGGFIRVDSEPDRGSRFTIYLPEVGEAVQAKTERADAPSTGGSATVLVVEDVVGLRRLITRALESAGYHVLSAGGGEEALRLLETHQGPVHLMLTDVVMPGMSGRALAERLAPTRPELKIMYMSGYTEDVVVRHGVSDDRMFYLSKPFDVNELIRAIRGVLGSSRGV